MHAPYAHGLITVAVGTSSGIFIGADATLNADSVGLASASPRVVEVARGFVIAGSGLWQTTDAGIATARGIRQTYHDGDSAESFLQRYDQQHRPELERFLTNRFHAAPDVVLRECFCPLVPPQSLVVCHAGARERRVVIFEYIPTLTNDDQIILTPLMQVQEAGDDAIAFGAIGAVAPFVDLLEREYVDRALRGPRGPEHALRVLIDEATARMPGGPATVHVHRYALGAIETAFRARPAPAHPAPRGSSTEHLPDVDMRDIGAVERFVTARYTALFPDARFDMLPRVFADVGRLFAGKDPNYGPIDLRYHDLEHTLQATVCLAALLAGRHAARVPPRLDARHFELAMVAVLLHDTGYLKLRTDTKGTGAKYTFCHVVRSCAFAATYLPSVGGNEQDVETVMSAINCTGPMNEISRLRFQAPIDEVIGCAVATADFLGQMAAPDYPDELEILYEEFRESDDFLHLPAENRMFKSAYDLTARTPQFWRRFVLPKLESEFHGVYRFLARPYPHGPNPYVNAIEANIAKVQQRLRTTVAPSADTAPHGMAAASAPHPRAGVT